MPRRKPSLSVEVFHAIMSQGPTIAFDDIPHDALADKLEDVGNMASDWVNIIQSTPASPAAQTKRLVRLFRRHSGHYSQNTFSS
jgi:hypothetical protein